MKSILILLSLFTSVTYAAQEKEGVVTLGQRVRSDSGHIYTLDAGSIAELEQQTFVRGSRVKFVATDATATVTDVVEEIEEQGHVPASTPVAPRPELETSLSADDESYEEVKPRVLVAFKDWKMSEEQRGKEIAHGCNLSLTYPEVDPDSWSAGHTGSFLTNNNWITNASASNFARDPRVIIILKLRGWTHLHRYTTGKKGLFQEMKRNNVITDGEARLMGYAIGDL